MWSDAARAAALAARKAKGRTQVSLGHGHIFATRDTLAFALKKARREFVKKPVTSGRPPQYLVRERATQLIRNRLTLSAGQGFNMRYTKGGKVRGW